MTVAEWSRLSYERQQVISENRSRRIRGLAPLPVPPRVKQPMGFEVTEKETGDYVGFIATEDLEAALDELRQHEIDPETVRLERKPRWRD